MVNTFGGFDRRQYNSVRLPPVCLLIYGESAFIRTMVASESRSDGPAKTVDKLLEAVDLMEPVYLMVDSTHETPHATGRL